MAVNILKNFPKSDFTDRTCPACKGDGVIKSSEFAKGGDTAKPKNTKDIKTDKPDKSKDKEGTGKGKTCTECSGITKVYTLRYE